MSSAPKEEPGDTLRSAFADAADFVADLVTDGTEESGRGRFAKGLRTAGTVARKVPSPEEAAVAWDASPLGRLERKLRERGIVRDRSVSAEHLRRGSR